MTQHDSKQRVSDDRVFTPAWSQRQRMAVPDRVPDYLDRPALIDRLMPTKHRVALLKAPGGFGKTTVLAACCRLLNEQGVPTAWLRADAPDDRLAFETYLAFAVRYAGVEVEHVPGSEASAAGSIEHLLLAIEAHAEPCVLALDELEKWVDPGAVEALSSLVRGAPPNLHVAIACRELPPALDIAEAVLSGRAALLTEDELRFSKSEIAEFFGLRLPRERLAALNRDSAGWPIALRIFRNQRESGTRGEARAFRDMFGNWLETRLWRGVSAEERDFLLDVGLVDRVDPELLDEVLDGDDARQRLQTSPSLGGLIGSAQGGGLHPLVRDHCAQRRFRETPDRFRSLHRRAALALERRGETIPAMRHAADSGDPELVGRILVNAGGLRFWIRQGPPRIKDAEPFLTQDVINKHPRLGLARCFLALFGDRFADAKRAYDLAATQTDGFTRNPAGDDRDVRIDHCITQGVSCLAGYTSVGAAHIQRAADDLLELARDDELEPATRGVLEFALCISDNLRAEFDVAFERAERSRQFVSDGRSPYLAMHIEIQLGIMAMARGRIGDAESWYARALKTAKSNYPDDATAFLLGDVLLRELELERNRLAHAVGVGLRTRDSFARPGNTFATYAAESAIVTELTEHAVGVDVALEGLSEMWEYARLTDRPRLARYLSALRVSVLAGADRIDAAERTWRTEGLPDDEDNCLTLVGRSWREMEALACARLRLFTAQEAFEPGRAFARRLLVTADAHRLQRTAMRALAGSLALEHRAGVPDAATTHLAAFLQRYANTDYARPLVREGDAGTAVLKRLIDSNPDAKVIASAHDLLAALSSVAEKEEAIARFTDRERDVLQRLVNQRDKEIAAELGITLHGVRYHVRQIFAKLGARGRHDAVHRARAIGVLPAEE